MSCLWNGTAILSCDVMNSPVANAKPESAGLPGCARAKMPKLCASQVVRALLAYSGLYAEASDVNEATKKDESSNHPTH